MLSSSAAMHPNTNHRLAVLETTPLPAAENISGIVESVDVVQRELIIVVRCQRMAVDVPPQCTVVLRGERIKLRIIQAGDVVRIRLASRTARSIAQRVEVAPVNSLPAAGET